MRPLPRDSMHITLIMNDFNKHQGETNFDMQLATTSNTGYANVSLNNFPTKKEMSHHLTNNS